MPLYIRKDFAELCGVDKAKVSVYVKRNKIIMRGDYIDTDIPGNAAIMAKWISEKSNKLTPDNNSEDNEPEIKPVARKKSTATRTVSDAPGRIIPPAPDLPAPQPGSGFMLDQDKKRAEIAYKESMTRIAELREAKMRGELIPTDLVGNIVSVLGYSFQTVYKNGAEALLIEISNRVKMDLELKAHYKGLFTEIINKAHKMAIEEAQNSLRTLVSEIAETDKDFSLDEDD